MEHEPLRDDALEGRWRALVECTGRPACVGSVTYGPSSKWWGRIQHEYSAPTRCYHTLDHLRHFFKEVDQLRDTLTDPRVVDFAVFFHDIIYDATSKTNEEDSAECFRASAAVDLGLGQVEIDKVVEYILATKSHAVGPEYADNDLKVFLDGDMSILGVAREDYLDYAAKIREEYRHIPRDDYLCGRAAVLEGFLRQPRIFASEPFFEKYEATARENIGTELSMLRGGNIPKQRTVQEAVAR